MTRRSGWTLHELLISLVVMSGIMALAAHWALGHLRFIHRTVELASVRGDVGESVQIVSALLWAVSPASGDIIMAEDSAIQFHAPIGTAVVCASEPGRITIPAASRAGNALASFVEQPETGDRLMALFEDTLGSTWLAVQVEQPPATGGACPFSSVIAARTLAINSPVVIPVGAPLRFTRPFRLSHYRGSDNRWYLGAREWNGETQRFNTIQPVAGPLAPHSTDAATRGLLLVYRDVNGEVLERPVDPARIASVTMVARAGTARAHDSATATVALRNAR